MTREPLHLGEMFVNEHFELMTALKLEKDSVIGYNVFNEIATIKECFGCTTIPYEDLGIATIIAQLLDERSSYRFIPLSYLSKHVAEFEQNVEFAKYVRYVKKLVNSDSKLLLKSYITYIDLIKSNWYNTILVTGSMGYSYKDNDRVYFYLEKIDDDYIANYEDGSAINYTYKDLIEDTMTNILMFSNNVVSKQEFELLLQLRNIWENTWESTYGKIFGGNTNG
jgi:hypothetical protein